MCCHDEPPVQGIAPNKKGQAAPLHVLNNFRLPADERASSDLVILTTLQPCSLGQQAPTLLSSSQHNAMTVYFATGRAGTATKHAAGVLSPARAEGHTSNGVKHPTFMQAGTHLAPTKKGLVNTSAAMSSVWQRFISHWMPEKTSWRKHMSAL
jgi:hypothetical protein